MSHDLLSIEAARERILADLSPLGAESVSLLDAAGRVLAEAITAERALPAFANSAMDGYAVRAADAPGELRVVGTVPAGSVATRALGPGEAMRIFTGAPIPPGADAVIMQEDTEARGERVQIRVPAKPGKHVRPAGEDVAAGELVAPSGAVLGAGDLGMLAAQGRSFVRVLRRPRVAVVPTGDEIVEIDRVPGPGQVANSNSIVLAAQVRRAGGEPVRCPVAPDEPERLARALADAARGADLVLTSGGVSVGDFDHVKDVLGKEGRVDFWRVAMKPGKPLAYGRLAGVPLIGLPGNPVSSFVCFELFAQPALRKLAGHTRLGPPRLPARLRTPVARDGKRRELVRARLERDGETLWVRPLAKQGSGHLASMLGVDALIDIAPGAGEIAAGAPVDIWLLEPTALC